MTRYQELDRASGTGGDGGASPPGRDDQGDGLVLHSRCRGKPWQPMRLNASEPVAFELENFEGRCLFLHRPVESYEDLRDDGAVVGGYPFDQHFQGRRRLWEWRLQGRFKRRPGTVYCGIELEDYVPVSFGTRAMMRAILPLIKRALQCDLLHHEIGREGDPTLRPTCVVPIWAADNTLVHDELGDAPDLACTTLPDGLSRKAARQYWETIWAGGGPSWDAPRGGPTFTFAVWGPSQMLDLRRWVFRRLPLMLGRELAMEPFCGRQPVHAVLYELDGGRDWAVEHRQSKKVYSTDIRIMPQALWRERFHADEAPDVEAPEEKAETTPRLRRSPSGESFCSAISHADEDFDGSPGRGEEDTEDLLEHQTSPPRAVSLAAAATPLVPRAAAGPRPGVRARLTRWLSCCKRRRPPARDLPWLEMV